MKICKFAKSFMLFDIVFICTDCGGAFTCKRKKKKGESCKPNDKRKKVVRRGNK